MARTPEQRRAYYLKNRERELQKSKEWREANRERYRLLIRRANHKRYTENPEKVRAATKKWERENPDKHRAYKRLQRAKRRGATSGTPVDRAYIIQRDSSICHICGETVEPNDINLDHLIPLSKGGEHTVVNLRVSHFRCNRLRSDGKLPAQLLLFG